MRRVRLTHVLAAAVAAGTMLASGVGSATSLPPEWTGAEKDWYTPPRTEVPEDRYALAGGCYAISSADGSSWVRRSDAGFDAAAAGIEQAEPFFFKATDLGSYMIYGTAEDFLAASEGALGQAAHGITRSHPGAVAGGAAFEATDAAADEVARSEANRQAGRGASVVAAAEASELADWSIEGSGDGFTIALPATGQSLAVGDNGTLELVETGGSLFTFRQTSGCTEFPEIEVNVDGPVVGGRTSFQETRGYLDAHLHMMAFEFLGGRARCGRPWHRYGVAHALVDCPDHKPDGFGAVLESVLQNKAPDGRHNTDGWPTFEGWPKHNSYTHEQVYYKWLERAWRGGLRMFTNLLVDNNMLCKIYPYKSSRSLNTDPAKGGPDACNEMDGVRLQQKRIYELQDYIDAQSGGPGEGWFRIVTDPFEAREVINDGKLAVVLGIEVSVPLDCGETHGVPRCDLSDVESGLDEVYDLGVRQMELVNKFDNALSGVAGDGGTTGVVVNQGNLGETGHYWKMETCTEDDGHAHDKQQLNPYDDADPREPEEKDRDPLAGAILALTGHTGRSGAAPVYPKGPHCNTMGLSDLGRAMIKGMAARGMIFDPDHMSARAQTQALDYLQHDPEVAALTGQPALVSSHGWSNNTIYPRIYEMGGVVTPYAGSSTSFHEAWTDHRPWADDRYYFGFGYGADTNGFGSQGGPRAGSAAQPPVSYPFEGFGGVQISEQRSGTKIYEFKEDGVAHYGLYPDWIEDLRLLGGDAIIDDMLRGPEAYLQMWERAVGIAPDACRADVADLTQADIDSLEKGMSPEDVLRALGQPAARVGEFFTYCVGADTATLEFTLDGILWQWWMGDEAPGVELPKPDNPDHPRNQPGHPHNDPEHPHNDPEHPGHKPRS